MRPLQRGHEMLTSSMCDGSDFNPKEISNNLALTTGLGGVNGFFFLLLIRMLFVGYSFATCLLLIFGLSTISGFLIEILLQLLEIPLGYYGIHYCK